MMRSSVDLPQPLGPISVTNSCSRMSSEASRIASTDASFVRNVFVT